MPVAPVLALAKGEGVAMSMFLTAAFFEAIRRTGALERDARGARTLAASVPVNLRQFFPSDSARNFFATITVSHTYGAGGDSSARSPGSSSRTSAPRRGRRRSRAGRAA
ncbi:hypothetical protein [Brachybacterium sp. GPGPB12]|uniref:hypothetical protein n=1 Tax=Brachybacterium sp. GPGPB12 TaxID=3023517 RepID=UPI0031344DE8